MIQQWRRRFGATAEEGFTLVEIMATIIVLLLIMGALVAIQIQSFRAVRDTRFFQQATALGTDAIESLRDLSYDSLSMSSLHPEFGTDPNITGCGPYVDAYDPDGSGSLGCEPMVTSPAPGFEDHIRTRTINDTLYTISRYVTWVDDDNQGGTDEDYKRISVLVEWTTNGQPREYRASTFVANARRGLPSPKFNLAPTVQTKEILPSTSAQTVEFFHTITQLGIDDTYDLTMVEDGQSTMPSGWSYTMYEDVGTIGVYEDGTDPALTNTSGGAAVDTGFLTTGESFRFIVRVSVPAAQPTSTTRLALTADPIEFAGDGKTVIDRVTPGGVRLYLHNDVDEPIVAPSGNSTAIVHGEMTTTVPTATTLFNYSTNFSTGTNGGRFIDNNNSGANEADADDYMSWVEQIGGTSGTTLTGVVTMRIWAAPAANFASCTNSSDDVNLTVYLRTKATETATTGTTLASQTVSSDGCVFAQHDLTFSLVNASIPTNQWFEVKVVANSTGGGDDVVIAYDTASNNANIRLPVGAL